MKIVHRIIKHPVYTYIFLIDKCFYFWRLLFTGSNTHYDMKLKLARKVGPKHSEMQGRGDRF